MTEKVKEIVAEMHKANQEKFFNPPMPAAFQQTFGEGMGGPEDRAS